MNRAIVKKILSEDNHIVLLEMVSVNPNMRWLYGITFDPKIWDEIYDTFETMNTNDILTVYVNIISNNGTYTNLGIPPNSIVCCVENIVGLKKQRKN